MTKALIYSTSAVSLLSKVVLFLLIFPLLFLFSASLLLKTNFISTDWIYTLMAVNCLLKSQYFCPSSFPLLDTDINIKQAASSFLVLNSEFTACSYCQCSSLALCQQYSLRVARSMFVILGRTQCGGMKVAKQYFSKMLA